MEPQLVAALNRDDAPNTGTSQQNLAWLLASVTVEDHTEYTVAKIAEALDRNMDKLRIVTGTLKKWSELDSNVWAFALKINGRGQDFADPGIGPMIDFLAAQDAWPDDVRDKVKAIGVKSVPRWKSPDFAIPVEPTLNAVVAVMTDRELAKLFEPIRLQAQQGTMPSIADIKASFGLALDNMAIALGL